MSHKPNPGLFQKVYDYVATIPKGKVATYGQIAKALELRDVRKVGWALHANPDASKVPCHRVVNKDGRLAPAYAFGGASEQRARLLSEEVLFKDKMHVDLKNCMMEV